MTEIITIAVSITASIISGMVLFSLKRYFDKKEKIDEEKNKVLAKENILILKSIKSLGMLTQANAIALKTVRPMARWMKQWKSTTKSIESYLNTC